jgi:uncharacterized protein (DUF1501 family)
LDRANRGLRGISRRAFLEAGAASGIALTLTRLAAAAAVEVCDLEGQGAPHMALQAATLLVKGDSVRDIPEAVLALLEVAGAA